MRWIKNPERSQAVAVWLFAIAALVLAMVVVGGATRLTGSGLSITQWKPISGAIPPLTARGWAAAFQDYRRIPQFRLVNPDMTLGEFKYIYGWEWAHRELARLLGLVAFGGLAFFLWRRRIPRRLTGRLWVLFGLGALQPLVGWWMVASGLEARVSVAPERLALHLGVALVLYGFAILTGLEAWAGRGRPVVGPALRWRVWTAGLSTLVFVQILLGALVAGNQAGRIDTDWPWMDGRLFPADYRDGGVLATLLHSRPAVQFDHRIGAYAVFVAALGLAAALAMAREVARPVKRLGALLAGAVVIQLMLGVATLWMAAPLALSLAHQVWAVLVLTLALGLAWRSARA